MTLVDIINSPWALAPEKLADIRAVYETHLRGEKIDIAGIEARLGRPLANEQKPYQVVDGVAVVPLVGVLAKRASLFMDVSGGVSTARVGAMLNQAAADAAVKAIVLEIDSPGGQVDGVMQLAGKIRAVRAAGKPVVAWVNGTAMSGGIWLASAAERIYIADATTGTGSIGVVATHVDASRANEAAGRKVTEITAGKYKRVVSTHEPLSAEGRQTLQDQVDALYEIFVNEVAAGRGAPVDKVLADMADGRIFIGRQAIDVGLVDGVATLDDLIAELSASTPTRPGVGRSANSPTQGAKTMDKAQLKAEHPEVFEAVHAEGFAAGVAQGKTEGTQEGTAAERARMLAIDAAAVVGYEDLTQQAKVEGKSAEQYALAVLQAEKAAQAAAQDALSASGAKPVASAAVGGDGEKPAAAATDRAQLAADAKAYAKEHNVSYVAALKALGVN